MKLDFDNYFPKHATSIPIPQPSGRWRRRPATWLIGVSLAIVAFCAMVVPTLIGAVYLAAGTRAHAAAPGGQDRAQALQAVADLEQARAWSPFDPAVYRALATSYLQLGRAQDAIAALEQAYRLQPGSRLIQQELAQTYEAAGQFDRANALWRSLGLAAPQMLALGEQARASRQYAKALVWYTRAGRAAPRSFEPLYYAGRLYRITQQPAKALPLLQRASGWAPDNRDVWYEIGQTHIARREGREALEALRHGLDAQTGRAGKSNLLFWIGYVQQYVLTPRDIEGARAAYEQALALNDFPIESAQKAETYYQSGILRALQKDWKQAIQEYRQALAANPKHYAAHISLAQTLWQVGQREAAYEQAREALALDPGKKLAYHVLGNFYAAERKVAEASAMYTRALEIDPQDAQVRKALDALR
jgi:tetratricopeptide (TPR) repeat protein